MILTMLQEGKITADEAHDLLEALAFSEEASKDRTEEQWAEVKDRLERAGDVVEQRLEQAREKIEQRIEEARVRLDAARDRAGTDPDHPIEGLEDVVVTVERGFSQFAKELPDAIARLVNFDFGHLGGHTVERVFEGVFPRGLSEATITVSTRNGSVTWDTWDEPGYKVVVRSKVRAGDDVEAEARAGEATSWEHTGNGFRVTAGDGRGVSGSVRVILPASMRYRLEAETRNGSIRARELLLTSGQFSTANGSIRLENVDARDLNATTANGSIRISGVVDMLRGTTAHGSIVVNVTEPEAGARTLETADWNLKTGSGSIRARLPESDDIGYQVDLKTGNGRVRAMLPGFIGESTGPSRRSVTGKTSGYDSATRRVNVSARTANGSIVVTAGEDD